MPYIISYAETLITYKTKRAAESAAKKQIAVDGGGGGAFAREPQNIVVHHIREVSGWTPDLPVDDPVDDGERQVASG